MADELIPLEKAGKLTLLAAVLNGISLLFLFVFFAVGGPFGTINDIIAIPSLAIMIPVGLATYQLGKKESSMLSLDAFISLVFAAIGISVLQILFLSGVLTFGEQLPWVLAVGSFLGVWYTLTSYLARDRLRRKVVNLGYFVGLMVIGSGSLFWIGFALDGFTMGDLSDPEAFNALHPAMLLGFMMILISYAFSPFWLWWLGEDMISLSGHKEGDHDADQTNTEDAGEEEAASQQGSAPDREGDEGG